MIFTCGVHCKLSPFGEDSGKGRAPGGQGLSEQWCWNRQSKTPNRKKKSSLGPSSHQHFSVFNCRGNLYCCWTANIACSNLSMHRLDTHRTQPHPPALYLQSTLPSASTAQRWLSKAGSHPWANVEGRTEGRERPSSFLPPFLSQTTTENHRLLTSHTQFL